MQWIRFVLYYLGEGSPRLRRPRPTRRPGSLSAISIPFPPPSCRPLSNYDLHGGSATPRFRVKMEELKSSYGLLPESQGQHQALTVVYVPYSLDCGRPLRRSLRPAILFRTFEAEPATATSRFGLFGRTDLV